jgi:hypothetical protein
MKRDFLSSSLEEDQLAPIEAAKHVASARHSLTGLRDKLGGSHTWPELEEAVTELEVALSILTTETGGML